MTRQDMRENRMYSPAAPLQPAGNQYTVAQVMLLHVTKMKANVWEHLIEQKPIPWSTNGVQVNSKARTTTSVPALSTRTASAACERVNERLHRQLVHASERGGP
jgi:hypothetical protein